MAGVRRNLFGSAYLTGANLASQLVLVPVYLHFWGAETYGHWLVLFTVPALFVFTDIGLSNVVGNAVTLEVERGRADKAQACFNAAWKYQLVGFSLVLGICCAGASVFPVRSWLGVEDVPWREFFPTVVLLCGYTLVWMQIGLVGALYRAARRVPEFLSVNAHTRLAEVGCVTLVLFADGGFIAVSGGLFCVRLAGAIFQYSRAKSALPAVRLSLFEGRWEDLKALLPTGVAYLSFPVSNALMNQGTVLAVNHLLGAPAVVALSVCRQLARFFTHGTGMLTTAIQPEMTVACASQDRSRIRDLQSVAVMIPMLAGAPFVVAATLIGPEIVEWWTRKDLGIEWILCIACSIEAVTFGATTLACLVCWATNRVGQLSKIYLVVNVVALLVGGGLTSVFGLLAIPGAFALANSVYCFAGLLHGARAESFSVWTLFSLRGLARVFREGFGKTVIGT